MFSVGNFCVQIAACAGVILLLFLSALLVGAAVRFCCCKKNVLFGTWASLFFNILAGTFTIICVWAFFRTQGRTVELLCLIPGTALLLNSKFFQEKNLSDDGNDKIALSQIMLFIFMFGLIFLLSAAAVFYWRSGIIFCKGADFRDWAVAVSSLNDGFENRAGFENFIVPQPLQPYHWGELWLAAFVVKIFNIPQQLACDVIVWPYLWGVFLCGLMCWSRGKKDFARSAFILSIPLLSLIFIYTFCVGKILHIQSITALSPFWARWLLAKDMLPVIILIACAVMIEQKRFLETICLLLLIPGTDISWVPSAYMGAALIFLLQFYNRYRQTNLSQAFRETWVLACCIGISGLLLCLLYTGYAFEIRKALFMESCSSPVESFLHFIIHIGECILMIAFASIVFYIIRPVHNVTRAAVSKLLLFGGFCIFGGIPAFLLCIKNYDAPQFFKFYIIINLGCWLCLSRIIDFHISHLLKRCLYIVYAVTIVLSVYCMYGRALWRYRHWKESASYVKFFSCLIEKNMEFSKNKKIPVIGVLSANASKDKLSRLYPERESQFPLGGYLPHYYYVCLNPEVSDGHNAFLRYCEKNAAKQDKCLKNFVKKYIDLLELCGNMPMPIELVPHTRFLCEEPDSGYRLYQIKK